MWNKKQRQILDEFIDEIKTVDWFSHASEIDSRYTVLTSIYEAHAILGDEEQGVWENEAYRFYSKVQKILSEEQIDAVFAEVSLAIGNELWDKLCDFEEALQNLTGEAQGGVEEDITDFIKRDMAWCCIEKLLGGSGFFTEIYELTKQGRFVCSWSGKYPLGNFIIM